MRTLSIALISILSIALSNQAHAVVLHGVLTGTITLSTDLDGRVFGGEEDGAQVGLPVTGAFTVDTALAPPMNIDEHYGQASISDTAFDGLLYWAAMEMTIAGMTFATGISGTGGFDDFYVFAQDAGAQDADGYFESRATEGIDPASGLVYGTGLTYWIYDELQTDFINGLTVKQGFTWRDADGDGVESYGGGSYMVYLRDPLTDDYQYFIHGYFNVDSLRVTVPVPAALVLLSSALPFLCACRRRVRHAAS